jgi:tellurite resistance protein TerC
MVIAPFFHISSPLSLAVVGSVLVLSILASIIFPVKEEKEDE